MPLLLQAGNKFLRGLHVVSKFPRTARPLSNSRPPTRPLASGAAAALHPLFRYWEIRPGIFRIEERFFDSWNRANMFYIRGTDRDMLVDTGTGIHDLPKYLSWAGIRDLGSEKPLAVILTHVHFDHSGGIYQFQSHQPGPISTGIHTMERGTLASGDPIMTAAWVTGKEVDTKPASKWNPRSYRVQPVTTDQSLEDGDEIHLGDGNSFQVLHLPGHSMGSIGLLNRRDGILVSGDTLYQTDSELIDWYPGSSVRHMYRSVERIRGLDLDLVLPGHNAEITSGESIKSHCERHLEMASKMKRRLLLKMLSRLRARTILEVNHRLRPLPEFIRVMMQH